MWCIEGKGRTQAQRGGLSAGALSEGGGADGCVPILVAPGGRGLPPYPRGLRGRLAGVAVGLLCTHEAFACAVCGGAPDSAHTLGLNTAIFFMLGVTGLVLGAVGFFVARVARATDEPGGEAG